MQYILHLCLEDAALTCYSLIPTQKTLMEDFYDVRKQANWSKTKWVDAKQSEVVLINNNKEYKVNLTYNLQN